MDFLLEACFKLDPSLPVLSWCRAGAHRVAAQLAAGMRMPKAAPHVAEFLSQRLQEEEADADSRSRAAAELRRAASEDPRDADDAPPMVLASFPVCMADGRCASGVKGCSAMLPVVAGLLKCWRGCT